VPVEIILKKLRFYARYIVVALILRRVAFVNDVLRPELKAYVELYRPRLYASDARGLPFCCNVVIGAILAVVRVVVAVLLIIVRRVESGISSSSSSGVRRNIIGDNKENNIKIVLTVLVVVEAVEIAVSVVVIFLIVKVVAVVVSVVVSVVVFKTISMSLFHDIKIVSHRMGSCYARVDGMSRC
jgi:hypothetical protein